MASQDLDRARSRFIQATNRVAAGLRLQRDRLAQQTKDAPRLLEGAPDEVANLTGMPENDLDYYMYELGRLQDIAREIGKVFDAPHEIVTALAAFGAAIPRLRDARNPLTHAFDDDRLDDAAWMSAFMHFKAGGKVEYLVDARYQHHDAAEALVAATLGFLRQGLPASKQPAP